MSVIFSFFGTEFAISFIIFALDSWRRRDLCRPESVSLRVGRDMTDIIR